MADFLGSIQERQGWRDESTLSFTRRVGDYLLRVSSDGFDRKWVWGWASFDPTVESSRQPMQPSGYTDTRDEAMALAVASVEQRLVDELERLRRDIGR